MPVSLRAFFAAANALCSRCSKLARDRSRRARHGERLFHLAENLRLAHDHGIQAGGHAEEMADRFFVAVLVEVRRENRCFDAEVAREELRNRCFRAVNHGQQLHAVAGGDDHALRHARRRGQGAGGLGQLIAADGDLLPQRDGRGFVVHANECERHWGPNLCTWLKKLAAQTAIITTSAAPET